MNTLGRIFLALDGLGYENSYRLLSRIAGSPLAPSIAGFKIHDLWDREGPKVVTRLASALSGQSWCPWVDLKLHDVPNTVSLRAKAVKDAGAEIVTVHASGGIEMMRAATKTGLNVLAITVLTSLNEEEVHLFTGQPSKAAVLYRARLAKLAGVWGLVCSPNEVSVLAKRPELVGLNLITPGIRLKGKSDTDTNQQRVNSPRVAFEAGATHIVVGSEVTQAGYDDQLIILGQIVEQIQATQEN
jgi:orotidine-5'-phosphate decarboxylase